MYMKYIAYTNTIVDHRFSFLCCVVFLCFICLRLVSCVPHVVSISGLSILDCSVGFL